MRRVTGLRCSLTRVVPRWTPFALGSIPRRQETIDTPEAHLKTLCPALVHVDHEWSDVGLELSRRHPRSRFTLFRCPKTFLSGQNLRFNPFPALDLPES
jgi:hypothetical protein